MKELRLKTPGIFALIRDENKRQIQNWGIQDLNPMEWLAIIGEEYGELVKAVNEHYWREGLQSEIVKEATQTATLCLKIAEIYLNLPIVYDPPSIIIHPPG